MFKKIEVVDPLKVYNVKDEGSNFSIFKSEDQTDQDVLFCNYSSNLKMKESRYMSELLKAMFNQETLDINDIPISISTRNNFISGTESSFFQFKYLRNNDFFLIGKEQVDSKKEDDIIYLFVRDEETERNVKTRKDATFLKRIYIIGRIKKSNLSKHFDLFNYKTMLQMHLLKKDAQEKKSFYMVSKEELLPYLVYGESNNVVEIVGSQTSDSYVPTGVDVGMQDTNDEKERDFSKFEILDYNTTTTSSKKKEIEYLYDYECNNQNNEKCSSVLRRFNFRDLVYSRLAMMKGLDNDKYPLLFEKDYESRKISDFLVLSFLCKLCSNSPYTSLLLMHLEKGFIQSQCIDNYDKYVDLKLRFFKLVSFFIENSKKMKQESSSPLYNSLEKEVYNYIIYKYLNVRDLKNCVCEDCSSFSFSTTIKVFV
jgi:hypothetical protein